MKWISLLCLSLFLEGLLCAEENTRWEPFVVSWNQAATSQADVSFLLDAPAGKHGFVRLQEGHLARGDGARLRFWGVNATGGGGLPAKERAPILAGLLARRGINCVRFHMLDWVAPRGLIAAGMENTRSLDTNALDRLDFFVAELKQRGIYADLNLNVGRRYRAGDGVRDSELLGMAKAVTFFDERLLELQREYARQLLTHVNPYTGRAYREEPAVALVELVNENSLIEAWFGNRLLGQNTRKNPDTWADIPASYAQALTDNYNAWLKEEYPQAALERWRQSDGIAAGTPIPRLRPAEFSKANPERFQAEAKFYLAVEKVFYQGMAKFLREELKVKALLVGNSDHGHSKTGYPQLAGTALLDVVDGHVYWQHPRYLTDPVSGKRAGFEINNTPMVDNPLRSTVVELSRSAFAGKPYTVSEVNHPFPAEYACEGVPILAAYAALQDWDGVFWYTLAHADVTSTETMALGHFDLAPDPVKMSQLAAGALMFLRGDVAKAQQSVSRSYTRDQVIGSIRLPYSEAPFFTPGFPLALPLQHAVRIATLEGQGPAAERWHAESASPLRSDTGELNWYYGEKRSGLVAIETARSQALVGFCTQPQRALKNLAVDMETPFCAVTLSALDGQTIAQAGRLLLTVTGRTANTDMTWNAKRTSLEKWGKAPARIEVVKGKVFLKGLQGAQGLLAQPLDAAGQGLGTPMSCAATNEGWTLPVGEAVTTWYAITVQR